MAYNDRIREARKSKHLTQEQLGKLVGCAKNTISGYEKGTNEPNMCILSKIMDVLGVDANYIFRDEAKDYYENTATPDEMENIIRKYRRLDAISKQAVLMLLDIESRRTASDKLIEFPSQSALSVSVQPASAGKGVYLGPDGFAEQMVDTELIIGADFGVPVRGDSMEPKYHDGDILLISMSQPVEVGDIALVTMDGCGYVKKIGHGELISLNRKYKPIPMTEDIRINGKVIGVLPAEQ